MYHFDIYFDIYFSIVQRLVQNKGRGVSNIPILFLFFGLSKFLFSYFLRPNFICHCGLAGNTLV